MLALMIYIFVCCSNYSVREKFVPLVESRLYDWSDKEQRDLLISTLMTSCDIATITKPWHIQRKVCDNIIF